MGLRMNRKPNIFVFPMSEFNEVEPWLKSAKKRFQLSPGLNKIEYNFKWNQPYLSRHLNLSRGSNSFYSVCRQLLKLSLEKIRGHKVEPEKDQKL